ncbi:MAG: hypothetical protein ACW99G_22080 [Candidatus Thorarchaeota archaeon]
MNKVLTKMVNTLSLHESPSVMKEDHFISLMTAFPIFAMTMDVAVLREELRGRSQLSETWKAAREHMKEIPVPDSFEPLSVKVIEKRGTCQPYDVGDRSEEPVNLTMLVIHLRFQVPSTGPHPVLQYGSLHGHS